MTGAGGATAQNQANLAALLSNLATGQGSQASNIALQGGQTQANAALQAGQAQTGLIGDLAGMYMYNQSRNRPPVANTPPIAGGWNEQSMLDSLR